MSKKKKEKKMDSSLAYRACRRTGKLRRKVKETEKLDAANNGGENGCVCVCVCGDYVVLVLLKLYCERLLKHRPSARQLKIIIF